MHYSKEKIFFLNLCLGLFLLSIFNTIQSALWGNLSSSRINVYVCLLYLFLNSFIYLLFHYKQIKYDLFSSVILNIFIFVLLVDLFNAIPLWNILKHCGLLLLLLVLYQSTSIYPINKHAYIHLFYIVFYVFIVLTIFARYSIMNNLHRTQAVINLSYYYLACLPILMLSENITTKRIALVFSVLISIYSMKRGAMICCFCMILVYYVISGSCKKDLKQSIASLFLMGILALVFLIIVNVFTRGALLSRFSIESLLDGSGRAGITKQAIDLIINRNIMELLFGSGSFSSVQCIGITLHNDFLEFMFCFGIIGLSLSIWYFVSLFLPVFNFFQDRISSANALAMLLVYSLCLAMFEGVIFNFTNIFVVIEFAVIRYRDGKQHVENE